MSDPTDLATEREQLELERAIAAARGKSSAPTVVLTECLNQCGEKPRSGSKYCSADCRDDYEHRQRHLRRLGVR